MVYSLHLTTAKNGNQKLPQRSLLFNYSWKGMETWEIMTACLLASRYQCCAIMPFLPFLPKHKLTRLSPKKVCLSPKKLHTQRLLDKFVVSSTVILAKDVEENDKLFADNTEQERESGETKFLNKTHKQKQNSNWSRNYPQKVNLGQHLAADDM